MKCVWGQLHLYSAWGCYWVPCNLCTFTRFFPRTTNCVVIYAKHDRFLLTTTISSGRHDIMLACHQIYLILICMRCNWPFYSYQVFRLCRISSSRRKPEIKECFFVHVCFGWLRCQNLTFCPSVSTGEFSLPQREIFQSFKRGRFQRIFWC